MRRFLSLLLVMAVAGCSTAAADPAATPETSPTVVETTASAPETTTPEPDDAPPPETAAWRQEWATIDFDAMNVMPDTIAGPNGSDARCERPSDDQIVAIANMGREAPNPPDWPQRVARVLAFTADDTRGLSGPGPRYVIAAETGGAVSLWGAAGDSGVVLPFPDSLAWSEDERAAGRDAAGVAESCL
ncbi:MAG: hypothetical protein LBK42_11895 [Propionibacteriaceae bacterium]|jgi:hypothetical protein|nr:hypothetical protein [Propionibacteriaceae bacterium]